MKSEKKIIWLMLFIVTLGSVLRLAFINKPDGLWNDEYVSWAIASMPLGKSFWTAVYAQCHMPLYYFYLKFFIHFFGNGDLMLRLTSVPPGILSIIAMYFVGKEFKDEKLGFLSASICALSSFLIYFSQEVRFYELLFLFSALSLLFTIKLTKKQSLSNIIFYIISNFLIIITHTIGFAFVLLNLIFTSIWLFKTNEKLRKSITAIWISIILLSLGLCPLIFKILATHSNSQWWGSFTLSRLGFLITDYFSPVLTNIVSAPDSFFYNFSLQFVIFALIPSGIAITGIFKSLSKNDENNLCLARIFFLLFLSYILILIIAALSGKLVFVTKYSIEVYPILILLMCWGILQFKKGWRISLIVLYCFLSLYYMLLSPVGAPRIRRSEGHKIVAQLLQNAKLNNKDFILLNYYPAERFSKYFDFSKYNVISINKGNYPIYTGVTSKKDFEKIDNSYFDKKFQKNILDKMKLGQKIAVVILNDVAVYSPMQMNVLFSNDKEYKKAPFMFLIFSYSKNKILEQGLKKMQILRIEQKGSWSVITFVKG